MPWILLSLAIGAGILVAFVLQQLRSSSPLLKLRLLSDRALFGCALVIAFMQFAMTGFVIQGSIYAQDVLGFTPLQAGASLLPMLVPVIVMVHIAGRWYDRAGVRAPLVMGTALATVGQLVQAIGAWHQSYPIMAVGMAIMGTGIALTMSPANTDALSRVAAHERGQVSGLVQTLRQIGGTTGVAITAAVVIFAQSVFGSHSALDSQDMARSMALGGLAAAAATATALVVALRFLRAGTQRPKSAT
jgi:MFS family permease